MALRRRVRDLWGVGFLLARLLFEVGPFGIPPVTTAAAMLQVAIYCRLLPVPWRSPWTVCMSLRTVVWQRQWRRLVFSQLEHADSWHLYGNMTSFVWKGIRLEKEMGSVKFARILLLFLVEVGVISLLLTSIFGSLIYGDFYPIVCSIGFSGVVFALKVLKNVEWNQDRVLPAWLVWFELLFIHMVAPESSLLGHLAGVLVGSAYVYGFSVSSLRLTPTCVATLVSGLIVVLRASVLPSSWTSSLHAPCLSADLVFRRNHWELLFLSPLHTTNDLHAAYVACSLMFLGSRYEREHGSIKFALRMLVVALSTGIAYCLSAWMILPSPLLGVYSVDGIRPYEMPYKCFTGCTALLLALKDFHKFGAIPSKLSLQLNVALNRMESWKMAAYLWIVAEISLAQGARHVGSSAPSSVPWYRAWLRGRYPFLWFELPCPTLLGAVLEVAFLRFNMPFLWTPGNAVGVVVGLLPGLIRRCVARSEPLRSQKPDIASASFCGI